MSQWRWVSPSLVYVVHDRQLAEHGGLDGVRDEGAVQSAIARPQNLAAYGEPDICDLAAAYAFGLSRNHGFLDGNKRTAWVIARVFLADNGAHLQFDRLEAVALMEAVAVGTVSEIALAEWFRSRMVDASPTAKPSAPSP